MSKEFLNTSTLKDAISIIEKNIPIGLASEDCPLLSALNRVASKDIFSPEDLPSFAKSTVDGYAVRSADTFGATEAMPIYLNIIGEVEIGKEGFIKTKDASGIIPSYPEDMNGSVMINTKADTVTQTNRSTSSLYDYTCVYIPTGGMLPDGADAIIMKEYTQKLDKNVIEVTRAVAYAENLINIGEDVKTGELILSKGRRITPQDIGLLAGLGITSLNVFVRPKVAVISSGAEIYPIDQKPERGKVRDINAYTISAIVTQLGGEPVYLDICPDNLKQLKAMIRKGLELTDCILISGGSSVGNRDFTYQAISELGPPGILLHGLSIRPGKPTIIGQSGQKPIIGLPGHPASAVIVTCQIVSAIIERLSGISRSQLDRIIEKSRGYVIATLTRNISSPPGREDFVRVTLSLKNDGSEGLTATPVFGKSGLISPIVKAHGILRISPDTEGEYEGSEVRIMLI